MAGPWFDTFEGKLVVGEAAYEQAVEQSFPGQIVALGELLLDPLFNYRLGDFEAKHRRHDMTPEEKIAFGGWVLNVLEQTAGEPRMLRNRHIQKLHILGLSPDSYGIWREFGGIDSYREAIGSPIDESGKKGRIDRMEDGQLENLAEGLAKELGRTPFWHELETIGLTRQIVYTRFGGKGKLVERFGHLNIPEWDKDDFIQWGITVMKVNGEDRFIPNMVRVLSARELGPGVKTIQRQFGSWSNFKEQVREAYQWEEEHERQLAIEKTERTKQWLASGKVPGSVPERAGEDTIPAIARYVVINQFALDMTEGQKIQLAVQHSKNLIPKLLKSNPALTAGEIEMWALSRHLFDDIWPFENEENDLYVSNDELEALRQKQRIHEANQRARQRGQQTMRRAS